MAKRRKMESVYLDPASVHAEILRRHPEMSPEQSVCYLDSSTSPTFASVDDLTGIPEGTPVVVASRTPEDYHGLTVEVVRWRPARA